MIFYYIIFIGSTCLSQINNCYILKKYQLCAGTSFGSDAVYMTINGLASALVSAGILFLSHRRLELTVYSFAFAFATVACSAVSTICVLKAYEKGQIAAVNLFQITGNLILTCLWGLLFLKESLSVRGVLAIFLMLIAVLSLVERCGQRMDRRLLWLYVTAACASAGVSILTKQHQVETAVETVDTLSYGCWIGLIRAAVFLAPVLVLRKKKELPTGCDRVSTGYAALSSLISGGCYIVTLFVAVKLPVVVTTPMGIGFGILISTILPWVVYSEKLKKSQLIGVILSFCGVMLFLQQQF